jgi:hypothetical protein
VAQGALPALESRVYVANDEGHRIDVFDVGGGHAPHHSITPRLSGRDLLNSRCVIGGQNGGLYRTLDRSTR